MKVCIGIEKFDPKVGGAERYLWDLSHFLAERGHDVAVICMKSAMPLNTSIKVHRVSCMRFPRWARHLCFAIMHYLRARSLRDYVHFSAGNTLYSDVYQPHGGVHRAWFEKDMMRYPARLIRKFMAIIRRLTLKDMVQRICEWWTFKVAKPEIIAISEMVRRDIIKWFNYPEYRVHIVPNGIDTKRFSPYNAKYRQEVRLRYSIGEDDFVFLFVANNLLLKGLGVLIDACRDLGDLPCRVLVLGGNSYYARMKVKLYGLSGVFVFGGRAEDMERVYPACECLVHPTYYDACSLTVLEALASGIPVITTASNGAAMYIGKGDGLVIPSADPSALSLAMRRLYGSTPRPGSGRVPVFRGHEDVFADVSGIVENYRIEKHNTRRRDGNV